MEIHDKSIVTFFFLPQCTLIHPSYTFWVLLLDQMNSSFVYPTSYPSKYIHNQIGIQNRLYPLVLYCYSTEYIILLKIIWDFLSTKSMRYYLINKEIYIMLIRVKDLSKICSIRYIRFAKKFNSISSSLTMSGI